jgi:hypothetical protein
MAIVNIKYDLADPEDEIALQRAMNSFDMALYIWEILHNGKRQFKNRENIDIDDVWQYLWEELKDHKIDIDKLVQ